MTIDRRILRNHHRVPARDTALVAFLSALLQFGSLGAQASPVSPPVAAKPAAGDTTRVSDMQMSAMADNAMSGPMDANMMKHMVMTPSRTPTHADSVRATKVATDLKAAIAKYQDTAVAVADGYEMFLPNVKSQHVHHFTNNTHALLSVLTFDPAKPTSILYKRGADNKLHLVGAMYTLPKSASLRRLDDRVPLSIAHWHRHVNWCLPSAKNRNAAAWMQTKDGQPVYGPESPIATKAECDAVHGEFHDTLFGWMLHANVYEGTDLGSIFADDHATERAAHKM